MNEAALTYLVDTRHTVQYLIPTVQQYDDVPELDAQ